MKKAWSYLTGSENPSNEDDDNDDDNDNEFKDEISNNIGVNEEREVANEVIETTKSASTLAMKSFNRRNQPHIIHLDSTSASIKMPPIGQPYSYTSAQAPMWNNGTEKDIVIESNSRIANKTIMTKEQPHAEDLDNLKQQQEDNNDDSTTSSSFMKIDVKVDNDNEAKRKSASTDNRGNGDDNHNESNSSGISMASNEFGNNSSDDELLSQSLLVNEHIRQRDQEQICEILNIGIHESDECVTEKSHYPSQEVKDMEDCSPNSEKEVQLIDTPSSPSSSIGMGSAAVIISDELSHTSSGDIKMDVKEMPQIIRGSNKMWSMFGYFTGNQPEEMEHHIAAKDNDQNMENGEQDSTNLEKEDAPEINITPEAGAVDIIASSDNTKSEEDEYSEKDPFGYEAAIHAKNLAEKRARAMEEDPFGFDVDVEEEGHEALLEAFRVESDDNDGIDGNRYLQSSASYKATTARNHDIRAVGCSEDEDDVIGKEVHPNQDLFDILDNNFDSLELIVIPSMMKSISSEDIKLCFVAFNAILTPPKSTPYAKEYNHDLDEEVQVKQNINSLSPRSNDNRGRRSWFFSRRRGIDHSLEEEEGANNGIENENVEREASSEKGNENSKQDREEMCMYIPVGIVFDLWIEVLKSRGIQVGLEWEETEKTYTKFVMFNHVKDALVKLGLIDVKKDSNFEEMSRENFGFNSAFVRSEDEDQNSSNNCKLCANEMIAVHHAINQQYGEYLGSTQTCATVIAENRSTWYSSVSKVNTEGFYANEDYTIRILPHTLVHAKKFDQAITMLADKVFIRTRLQSFGVVDGTTAQVTDVENLTSALLHIKSTEELADAESILISVYDQVRKHIERNLRNTDSNDFADGIAMGSDDSYKLYTAAGKAFHLMAVSFGTQGMLTNELDYLNEALRLKRLGVELKDRESNNPMFHDTISISDTLHCMGFSHDNSGNFDEALMLYGEALEIRKALLGDDHERVAETSHNKGTILCENGECEDALIFLEEALRIRTHHLGEFHESVADTQQWLGNVMRELGNMDNALEYFNKAVRIKKHKFGDNDEGVASVLHNMAIVLDDMEKYNLSIKCYKEALRIRQLQYTDQRNLVIADTLLCIGHSTLAFGDHADALVHFTESIQIREFLLESKATGLLNLSHIGDVKQLSDVMYVQVSKLIECYEEALSLTKKEKNDPVAVLHIFERLGELYSTVEEWESSVTSLQEALTFVARDDTSNCSNDGYLHATNLLQKIAQVHILKGEYTVAQSYLNRAWMEQKRYWGDNPPLIPSSLYCSGVLHYKLNQHEKALISFTECLRSLKRDGNRDIILGHTLYWLGRQHFGLGEYNKAISRYISALHVYKENRPLKDNQVVIQTLHSLGNTNLKKNELQLALKSYKEEIKLYENNSQFLYHPSAVAEAFCCAGDVYAQMNNYEEAIYSFEECLSRLRDNDNITEREKIGEVLEKIGTMYMELNDYEHAKETLYEAHAILLEGFSTDDIRTGLVTFKLAQTLDETHDFIDAINYYADSLEIREKTLGKDDAIVATTLLFMGINACARSSFEESIDFFQRALRIRRKVFGANDAIVASTLHELGKAYRSNKSSDKAVVCFKEALRIWKTANLFNDAGIVSFDIAMVYEENNDYALAVDSLKDCVNLFADDTSHKLIPSAHRHLGFLYEHLDKWVESISELEMWRELSQNLPDVDTQLTISVMRSLCQSKVKVAKVESHEKKVKDEATFSEALSFYLELQEFMKANGMINLELADTYFESGYVFSEIENHEKALESFRHSLTIARGQKQKDEQKIADALLAISSVQEKLEMYKEASEHAIEALRIFRLKNKHVDIVRSLILLACINEKSGSMEGAIECFEECEKLGKQMGLESDLTVASSLHDFACLIIRLGGSRKSLDLDRALELLHEAVKIRVVKLGKENPSTADSFHRIGEVFVKSFKYEKALKYLSWALKVKEHCHQDVTDIKYLIGIVHCERNMFQEATLFLQESLVHEQESKSMAKHDLSRILHYLGKALLRLGRHKDASTHLERAIMLRKEDLGEDSIEYAMSMTYLGQSYYGMESYKEAISTCLLSLSILKRDESSSDSIDYADTMRCLGKSYCEMGRFDEALLHLIDSLKMFKTHESSNAVEEVLLDLGDVHTRMGTFTKAINYLKESIRLMILQESRKDEIVAKAMGKLGDAYLKTECFKEAMDSFEQARMLLIKSSGKDASLELGNAHSRIASVLQATGKLDASLDNYVKALDILKKCVDIDDLSLLASVLMNIGTIHNSKRNFIAAEEFCLEALKIRRTQLNGSKIEIAETLVCLAVVQKNLDKTDDAGSLYKEACEIYLHAPKYEFELGTCLNSLASIHLGKDEMGDAQSLYMKALNIFVSQNAKNTIEAASSMFGLGVIYRDKCQYKEAFEFLKSCLNTQVAISGKESLCVLETCEELGFVLISLQRYLDALKVYQTALYTCGKLPNENKIRRANIIRSIGDVFSYLKKFDLALENFESCLQIFRREIGDTSEEVANVLFSIGKVHDQQVDNEAAMRYMSGALEIRKGLFGKDSLKVAETLQEIATNLEDWGDTDEAMEYFRDALRIIQLNSGYGDLSQGKILDQIGNIHREKGNFASSLEAYSQALRIYRLVQEENPSQVGHLLQQMGAVHDSMSEFDESLKCYSEALEILKTSLGNEDLEVALALNNLGINLSRRGEYAKAFEFCTEALRIRQLKLDDNHLDIADALYNIGHILDDWGGKDRQTIKFYVGALDIYRSNLGDDDEDVASCHQSLGLVHMKCQQYDDALLQFSQSLRILHLNHATNSLDIAGVLFHIGRIYAKRADYQKALGCFEECLKIRTEKLDPGDQDLSSIQKLVDATQRKIGSMKRRKGSMEHY